MKMALFLLSIIVSSLGPSSSHAKVNSIDITQKTAENQIRHLLEPLLDQYCHDQCKLMNVNVSVDLTTPEDLAPGFDDIEFKKASEIVPSSGRVKMLIDDKVGPVSRTKLLELIQQYLDTLDYPVKVDTQVTHFPVPQGSEGKIGYLREKVSKQFLGTLNELLQQFCPQQCLLADFDLKTEVVNGEETQYGTQGEFVQDGETAIRIKDISATLLLDESLTREEQANILEMARLKTNSFKNVTLTPKALKFPRPANVVDGRVKTRALASDQQGVASTESKTDSKASTESKSLSDSKTNSTNSNQSNSTQNSNNTNNSNETNLRQERFERIEKIERVENGDAVQAELKKFKVYGLVFACSVFALLIFIALSVFKPLNSQAGSSVHRIIQSLSSDPAVASPSAANHHAPTPTKGDTAQLLSKKYEIERLLEELTAIYAQQPRVAKQVFSRILTEEGMEVTAECIHLFGEGIIVDMLRDPSLQTDLTELLEYYAKNPIELTDDEKLDLLKKLHSRTVAGKLVVLGSRSSNLFDFLAEMDGLQILELIRTESLTIKSIVLTQCDAQKRSTIYAQMDPDLRMKILSELSRIDYLPRDYIFNVATALKRKRRDNPKLNTEALPGSEVLVGLLERTGHAMQKTVIKGLEAANPDSARVLKSKLVSIDTMRYLRDGQLLEVVLSLKHDELIQFLKGAPADIRNTIFSKAPRELVLDLEEELEHSGALSREAYLGVERKILNRIKIMAVEGHINLIETNERMFSDNQNETPFVQAAPGGDATKVVNIKKVAGW